jgi:hypothetical protein
LIQSAAGDRQEQEVAMSSAGVLQLGAIMALSFVVSAQAGQLNQLGGKAEKSEKFDKSDFSRATAIGDPDRTSTKVTVPKLDSGPPSAGPGSFWHKHIGGVRYEDIQVVKGGATAVDGGGGKSSKELKKK